MTFYDIIILVLLLGAVVFGYWKGLAWQIASVAAVVVSYFAAYRFRDQVAQFVQAEPPFNRIAAMLIIFVACSLIIWLALWSSRCFRFRFWVSPRTIQFTIQNSGLMFFEESRWFAWSCPKNSRRRWIHTLTNFINRQTTIPAAQSTPTQLIKILAQARIQSLAVANTPTTHSIQLVLVLTKAIGRPARQLGKTQTHTPMGTNNPAAMATSRTTIKLRLKPRGATTISRTPIIKAPTTFHRLSSQHQPNRHPV